MTIPVPMHASVRCSAPHLHRFACSDTTLDSPGYAMLMCDTLQPCIMDTIDAYEASKGEREVAQRLLVDAPTPCSASRALEQLAELRRTAKRRSARSSPPRLRALLEDNAPMRTATSWMYCRVQGVADDQRGQEWEHNYATEW